jgi:hypothetical protein
MEGKIVALRVEEWNKCCKPGNFDAKCGFLCEIRRMAAILLGAVDKMPSETREQPHFQRHHLPGLDFFG